jgi:hypothetical protein
MTDEEGEQVELTHRQVQVPAGAAGAPCRHVDLQLSRAHGLRRGRRAGRAGPAQDGLHTQGQLPRAERLGHVVVGTTLKPQHAVALLAERRQHDHRQRNPRVLPLTQASAHLQAADSWQHQIEHDQIGPPRRGKLQRGPPVHRMPGFQASVAQVVHDNLRHGQVIFDNKNARVHNLSLRTPGSRQGQ